MSVIVLVGNKGGAGKTTLAVNLAEALGRRVKVALIDADPQGSALHWDLNSGAGSGNESGVENGGGMAVFAAKPDMAAQVAELSRENGHVVIDCPPSVLADACKTALALADLALIPLQPSPLDLWAMVSLEEALEQARKVNPGLSAFLVINQFELRTTLSRLMQDALSELDIAAAKTPIRRRAVYRASAIEGRSVFGMGRRGADAAAEIEQLINEVMSDERTR